MPNWADNEDRFFWQGSEIPHPPIRNRPDCSCAFCARGNTTGGERKRDGLKALRDERTVRTQTILTPAEVLDPLRSVWGSIGLDPCYAAGALTEPDERIEIDWSDFWTRAEDLADWTCEDPEQAIRALRGEDKITAEARKLRESLRKSYPNALTLPWSERTFINPPYGDKGPECVLGGFRDFLTKFGRIGPGTARSRIGHTKSI